MKTTRAWWKDGVQFECQGSGKCCTSHGEYGFVFLTLDDQKRMASHLGETLRDFRKKYCDQMDKTYHLKEDPKNPDCMFLKDKRCAVYAARPTQCRTWPFWPEVMSPKKWSKDVAAFCPGVGKGSKVPAGKIQAIIAEQLKAEKEY
jgi:Fe-S-cluster containining protein